MAAGAIRPTIMLSEFEYLYFDPGRKLSLFGAKDSRARGGGALSGDFSRALMNALVGVVRDPAGMLQEFPQRHLRPGPRQAGQRLPTVSLKDSLPSATRDKATAPLNAFATLASRIESKGLIGAPVATLAVPARCSTARRPAAPSPRFPAARPAARPAGPEPGPTHIRTPGRTGRGSARAPRCRAGRNCKP